jgi:signal transduction histidine kinase
LAAERRARAAERLAELGQMTGGLAHEIKNPLSTIGLNAQLLAEGIEDLPGEQPMPKDARQRLLRRLDSLRRETERLRGILTDFLAYAGELRLDPKPTDLNRVVEELADFFSPQAQHHGVRLRLDLHAEPLPAMLDAAHLKQAILNLMLNAVAAMQGNPAEKPKELIIKTGVGQAADAAAEAKRVGAIAMRERAVGGGAVRRTLVISVTDTGPGIPPETQQKLFQPYFTTRSGGSGLGLATTRRIVEAMQGKIEVRSEVGQGAQFTIVLAG